MPDNHFPELVTQHSHVPGGHHDQHSFEDTLRDLLRNSPYLGISVLVHGIILIIFMNIAGRPAEIAEDLRIEATADEFEEPIPPEPPPPEKIIEEIDEIVEEPVVSEDVVEVTEILENISTGDFDSTGLNDVIGVGGGGGKSFGKMGHRGSAGTKAGSPYNEVIDLGLKWLKHHQFPDGYWSCAGFDEMCGTLGSDTICSGPGSPAHDVGITGLALLAFLGAGHSPTSNTKYSDVVNDGLKYLNDIQQSNGNFGVETNPQYTYDHLIATLAMCEAYALTEKRHLKRPANKALKYMYSIRNPGGAWRYSPDHPDMIVAPNDTSVTGWAIMAMTTAKEYGLEFDADALEDSIVFFEEMTSMETGRCGYTERGLSPPREAGRDDLWPATQTESLTAVGVLCRIFVDPDLARPNNKEAVDKGVALIERLPPLWSDDDPGRIDFYFWYYGSYALYQYQEVDRRPWNDWQDHLTDAIAKTQHKEGEQQGSWDPQVDPWGHMGGRIYSTALNILTMEVYYRYDTVMGSH